jgi:uncharacterized protein (UPF0335 family)
MADGKQSVIGENGQVGGNAREQMRSIIERVERLEEEKKSVGDDIRDVYAEAKGNGFDVKALRTIVRLRKLDPDERKEQEAILETYMHALGMLGDTPLGKAAAKQAAEDAAERVREKRTRKDIDG